MTKLGVRDQRHLDSAIGWLGLGNWQEANEELDLITPEIRAHPEVLSVRWLVYSKAHKWELAFEVAQSLSQNVPDASFGFVHMAVALHEMKRTEEARNVLLPVLNKFRDNYMMRYNLACYSCRMGKLKEASKWLKEAIDLDKTGIVRGMALEDPDLEALWTQTGEI